MLLSAGCPTTCRLGRPASRNKAGPVQLDSAFNILCIAAGERFSVVLYSDGRACFWGENSDFEIGLTSQLTRFEFIETVRLD
jgi:alpha-tubulin suppressor-like RCC1 family protein